MNASALFLSAFTVERYIAICHPMKAQYICTLSRAKRIIICCWTFAVCYSSPWLVLAHIKTSCITGFGMVNRKPSLTPHHTPHSHSQQTSSLWPRRSPNAPSVWREILRCTSWCSPLTSPCSTSSRWCSPWCSTPSSPSCFSSTARGHSMTGRAGTVLGYR